MIHKGIKCIWGALAVVACIAGLSAIFMLLWNALIPAIFGGVVINYWQALGLLVLSRLLFGGFGPHKLRGCFGHHHHGHIHSHLREMHDMHHMSKEKRKEFLRRHMKMHGFCCDHDQEGKESVEDTKE